MVMTYSIHYNSKVKDQPGKVANPARCQQLSRENVFSLSPFAPPEKLVSRQPAHRHTQADTYGILSDFRDGVHLFEKKSERI